MVTPIEFLAIVGAIAIIWTFFRLLGDGIAAIKRRRK